MVIIRAHNYLCGRLPGRPPATVFGRSIDLKLKSSNQITKSMTSIDGLITAHSTSFLFLQKFPETYKSKLFFGHLNVSGI